jgi:hypothetical protein
MIIETKFNVGDIVWVARSYPESHLDSIVVDGKTYWASHKETTYTFNPVAKQKIITEFEIKMTANGIDEVYWGRNINSDDPVDYIIFSTGSNLIVFDTEEEAYAFAAEKAANGESFYG